eukprot:CAMPEP_0167772084 /NCGR_PEP_ID=MMETSP0111_2-20121227/645_1 /TAXON_ID=91324 /ORGANISM="Lotharella globosa, Strain CCCM811" /LENGTH=36 /DNA_ID= /DNA_START= /DNA_END= /DNA_ORIENTATION=
MVEVYHVEIEPDVDAAADGVQQMQQGHGVRPATHTG